MWFVGGIIRGKEYFERKKEYFLSKWSIVNAENIQLRQETKELKKENEQLKEQLQTIKRIIQTQITKKEEDLRTSVKGGMPTGGLYSEIGFLKKLKKELFNDE